MHGKPKRIAIFLRDLEAGGIQKITANLIQEMTRQGVVPDLILATGQGPFLKEIPPEVRVFNFNAKKHILSFFKLSDYLRTEKPDALLSAGFSGNVAATIAHRWSGIKSHLILATHNTLSMDKRSLRASIRIPLMALMQTLYPLADTILAVSQASARDLEKELKLKPGSVKTIYNPVVSPEMMLKSQEPNDHPWFQPGQPPVFLTAGRLFEQKNHRNLIEAFAGLRKQQMARLVIFGEGGLRESLAALITELGLESDIWMPGFVANPFTYMRQASAFVLSSDYEALPTVLIEAMACGCPVVSTDCPYGPAEILEEGKYGLLVPSGDATALASAMQKVLELPTEKQLLTERARDFEVERITAQYLRLFESNNSP
jgi:glycosyltransferase involved in cell wall biosynthesis